MGGVSSPEDTGRRHSWLADVGTSLKARTHILEKVKGEATAEAMGVLADFRDFG